MKHLYHKNFFQIDAENEYEAGFLIGELFQDQLKILLEECRTRTNWQYQLNHSLPFLSVTKKYFPHLYQELRGQAEGAGIDIYSLWAVVIEDELDIFFTERCTTVVTNDGLLLGHNEDWEEDAQDYICVMKKKIGTVTTLELFYLGTLGGNSLSINSYGTIQSINMLQHTDYQMGVPRTIIARHLSGVSDPWAEIKSIEKIKRSSGFHHLILDNRGQCFSLENSAYHIDCSRVTLPFAHTNHYLSKIEHQTGCAATASSINRLAQAQQLYSAHMTNKEMKYLLDFRQDNCTDNISNKNTIAQAYIDLSQMQFNIKLRREEDKGWISYPLDFLEY